MNNAADAIDLFRWGAKILQVFVPGPPRAKGRPRFGRTQSGHPIAFTDSKTVAYEQWIAHHVRSAMTSEWHYPLDCPLALYMRVCLRRPKSLRKSAPNFADRRPDLDNYVKSACDGLLRAGAITDDARICFFGCSKEYETPEGLHLRLETPSKCP